MRKIQSKFLLNYSGEKIDKIRLMLLELSEDKLKKKEIDELTSLIIKLSYIIQQKIASKTQWCLLLLDIIN